MHSIRTILSSATVLKANKYTFLMRYIHKLLNTTTNYFQFNVTSPTRLTNETIETSYYYTIENGNHRWFYIERPYMRRRFGWTFRLYHAFYPKIIIKWLTKRAIYTY
jgi:hypothetical protein